MAAAMAAIGQLQARRQVQDAHAGESPAAAVAQAVQGDAMNGDAVVRAVARVARSLRALW